MTDRVQAVADYLDECGIANEPVGISFTSSGTS